MSLTVGDGLSVSRYRELNRTDEIREKPVAPPPNPAADSRVAENNLFGTVRRNNIERNFTAAQFTPQKAPLGSDATSALPKNAPPTPFQATEQIKKLPVPVQSDVPAVQAYNRQRAEIADAAIANGKPPQREDFNSLPGRTADFEYREALSGYNAAVAELRDVSTRATAKPNELPLDAPLAPYAALERIKQIPVPNPSDAAALDRYIQQTQTIAESSLEQSPPPTRADFNGLPPQVANMEHRDALQAYNQIAAELQPYADGISYVRYDATVNYMYDEMITNLDSQEFKFIKDNLDLAANPPLFSDPNATTGYVTAALTKFYNQVKTGGPWDHKPILEEKLGLEPGVDLRFPVRGDTEHEVFYDIWSNVHYGYVGTAAGFAEGELQTAADIAEEGTGKNDPADKITIQIGIDLWNKYGENMTKEQFEAEIQTRLPEIIAAQQTKEYTDKNGDFQHVSDISEGNRR